MKMGRLALGQAALAVSTAVCQEPRETATGTRYLVQAFAGFNQPNDI
jgi:hypothetical protein